MDVRECVHVFIRGLQDGDEGVFERVTCKVKVVRMLGILRTALMGLQLRMLLISSMFLLVLCGCYYLRLHMLTWSNTWG